MAFIEPMHRNKPNITYLLTPIPTAHPASIMVDRGKWWVMACQLAVLWTGVATTGSVPWTFYVVVLQKTRPKSAGPCNFNTVPEAHRSYQSQCTEEREAQTTYPVGGPEAFSSRRWSLSSIHYHVSLVRLSGSVSSNLAVSLLSTHKPVTSLGHEIMNTEPFSNHSSLRLVYRGFN